MQIFTIKKTEGTKKHEKILNIKLKLKSDDKIYSFTKKYRRSEKNETIPFINTISPIDIISWPPLFIL